MYARFVTQYRHWESNQPLGVIRATWWYDYRIDPDDLERIDKLCAWFNDHLPVPGRFARSREPGADRKAICWFKPTAERFIAVAREIAEILEKNGITTELWRTRKPGYVVYEDAYQVAAEPFRDTMIVTPRHRAPVRYRFVRYRAAVGPVLSRAS